MNGPTMSCGCNIVPSPLSLARLYELVSHSVYTPFSSVPLGQREPCWAGRRRRQKEVGQFSPGRKLSHHKHLESPVLGISELTGGEGDKHGGIYQKRLPEGERAELNFGHR